MHQASIFSALLLLVATAANAAMFKWTDANGHVQYGQHPPAGVDAKNIQAGSKPKSTPASPSLQQQVEALDKRLAGKAKQEAEAKQKQQNAKNRKINCENARKNIERMNYGGNRLAQMPDGSYQRLDEKQKQAQINKNKKAIKEFCD
ncbi:hypothetical protein MNBD_GAMMA13-1544 [hydrothermal vent metagenome]|uniref:DUF4124 domain-containing protein n=1 Tax=hydrothermal vent metagenome TaxID=652676 RepID=A0A3B0YRD6_9ZZZZ